jgi:hypothetical protein
MGEDTGVHSEPVQPDSMACTVVTISTALASPVRRQTLSSPTTGSVGSRLA